MDAGSANLSSFVGLFISAAITAICSGVSWSSTPLIVTFIIFITGTAGGLVKILFPLSCIVSWQFNCNFD